MNRRLPIIELVAVAILLAGCSTSSKPGSSDNTPPPGFTALFDGVTLSGWWGGTTEDPRKYTALCAGDLQQKQKASLEDVLRHWSVQNGKLVNDGQGLCLATERFYGDFELLVDYKTAPRASGGIYLRGCPEVQIWDSTGTDKSTLGAVKGSGGLGNNSPGAPGKDPLVTPSILAKTEPAARLVLPRPLQTTVVTHAG